MTNPYPYPSVPYPKPVRVSKPLTITNFRNKAVVLLGLLDHRGQVTASAVLHEDVQCPCVAVNVAVIVLHDVIVV
jgi:hypothetical protein